MSDQPIERRAAGHSSGQNAPSIVVLVRFEPAQAVLLAWKRANKPPASTPLRSPQITEDTFVQYPPGAGEILVAFYDRNWRRLSTHAMWARADYFGDKWSGPRTAQLSGGMVPPRFDDRALHLLLPDGAAYMAFFRSRVERGGAINVLSNLPPPTDGRWGRTQLNLTFLGAYILPGISPHGPPHNIPWPFDKRIFTLTPEQMQLIKQWIREGWHLTSTHRDGSIDSSDTLHGSTGEIGNRFNIVIMGDGFKLNEMATLEDTAKVLAQSLLDIEPYKSFSDSINVFIVRTVSDESGITRCYESTECEACTSAYTTKDTYLAVQGCWVNEADPSCFPSSPSYLGTEHPEWVYAAGEEVAHFEDVDLYIVLANSTVYGGSAFRSQKIAFILLCETEDTRFHVTAHETAHVVADIVEEYLSPLPWDGSEHDNVVSRDKMSSAWWKTLAQASELTSGAFKYVADCRNPGTGDCDSSYNSSTYSGSNHLGLYWGAQFIDADEDPCALDICSWDAYTETLGNNFFRPMPKCRMRSLDWNYCRACEEKIRQAIQLQIP